MRKRMALSMGCCTRTRWGAAGARGRNTPDGSQVLDMLEAKSIVSMRAYTKTALKKSGAGKKT